MSLYADFSTTAGIPKSEFLQTMSEQYAYCIDLVIPDGLQFTYALMANLALKRIAYDENGEHFDHPLRCFIHEQRARWLYRKREGYPIHMPEESFRDVCRKLHVQILDCMGPKANEDEPVQYNV
jgi:hypothetical protein